MVLLTADSKERFPLLTKSDTKNMVTFSTKMSHLNEILGIPATNLKMKLANTAERAEARIILLKSGIKAQNTVPEED